MAKESGNAGRINNSKEYADLSRSTEEYLWGNVRGAVGGKTIDIVFPGPVIYRDKTGGLKSSHIVTHYDNGHVVDPKLNLLRESPREGALVGISREYMLGVAREELEKARIGREAVREIKPTPNDIDGELVRLAAQKARK